MILTVDELRDFINTGLADESLQVLLDAAEESIIDVAGPSLVTSGDVGDVTEQFRPNGSLLILPRLAQDIVAVSERAQWSSPTTLASDDYELSSTGQMLRRLHTGTNPSTRWHPAVEVTYTPYTDDGNRKRVQVALVKLDITVNPALAAYTTGSDSETYRTDLNYTAEREAILASLFPGQRSLY